jgi:hypothetical protein
MNAFLLAITVSYPLVLKELSLHLSAYLQDEYSISFSSDICSTHPVSVSVIP